MFHVTEIFVRNCIFFFVCALTFVFAAIFLFLCLFICSLTTTCWGGVGADGDDEEDYFELETEKPRSWRTAFRVRQQLVEFKEKTKRAKVYAV
uniref:Uncharacterized protein n=1 Tax=Steinernema glaseri TaxID=37863 RepID=A0A1I8AAY3_9BILA